MSVTIKQLVLAVIVLVAALLALYLSFGRDDDSLRLQAQVTGTATEAGAGTYRASGAGLANDQFGRVTLSGSGSGELVGNCVSFNGVGALATAIGTLQLRLAKPGRACLTQAAVDQATGSAELKVTVTVEATGTDGSLLGRHGHFKARGTLNTDTGGFSVELDGRLRR